MTRGDRLFRAASRQSKEAETERASRLEKAALGLHSSGPEAVPYVALKYYRPDHECFSEWTAGELRSFSDLCRKMCSATWPMIYRSGGSSGNKTGFGYTPYEVDRIPDPRLPIAISEDVNWFELRVGGKARVHGFRAGQAFFLVFLDRNHRLLGG